MTIWYIGPSGSDTTGNGTSGNPYATVAKCIAVGVNGDTIKALTGTYTISSTTNITKQIILTSNSGVKTDVIFNSNTTVFNVQSSNVSITYVTLQTSSASALITIDRMSTGTTVPTFWTSITINNCNIKYVTNALELNGTFTVTNNAFTRMSESNIADIIKVYSTRGTCSISNNTLSSETGPVRYFIYLTSSGSGTYYDRCNSKGGTLTIDSNTMSSTNSSQVLTYIYIDYYNQYTYGTVGMNEQYNINTKLYGIITNNSISIGSYGRFLIAKINNSNNTNMFGVMQVSNNVMGNTDYGIIHLDKLIDNSIINIDTTTRNIFKIFSNSVASDNIVLPVSYTPLLWLSGQTLTGTYLTSWPSKPATISTMNCIKSGSCNYPMLHTEETHKFVRFGDTAFPPDANYNACVSLDNVIHTSSNQGFTGIICFRYYSTVTTLTNIIGIFGSIGKIQLVTSVVSPPSKVRIYNVAPDFYFNDTAINNLANTWIIIAFRSGYNSIKIFTNAGSNSTSMNIIPDSTYKVYLGKNDGASGGGFMDVRECILYDKGLTDSEISNIINTLKTTYTDAS